MFMSTEPLPLPPSSNGSFEEGKLLLNEAKEYIAKPLEASEKGEPRAESKKRRIKNYTGERLFSEEPQRYRLISALLREGVAIRQIGRACLSDTRTVRSVERREAQSVPSTKTKLIGTLGRVATMTAARMEEEIPRMNPTQLAVTCGIATDKLQSLTGADGMSLRVEHVIAAPGESIFDRMARLHAELVKSVREKTIRAQVIEPSLPVLSQ
jgi:hypothetical protein